MASSVRITPAANQLLSQLSEKLGHSKAQVIEEALRRLEELEFWNSVQAAFDSGETDESRAERELWDSTVSDGLAGGRW